jgi:excisionase family DNA binding protein
MLTLLTVQETADLLKVSRRSINRWSKAGKLASHRLSPRTTRFTLEDVTQFLNQHREA